MSYVSHINTVQFFVLSSSPTKLGGHFGYVEHVIRVRRLGLSIAQDVLFSGCDPELCCRTGSARTSPCHPNAVWCARCVSLCVEVMLGVVTHVPLSLNVLCVFLSLDLFEAILTERLNFT